MRYRPHAVLGRAQNKSAEDLTAATGAANSIEGSSASLIESPSTTSSAIVGFRCFGSGADHESTGASFGGLRSSPPAEDEDEDEDSKSAP
jgi:hypothetical protein